MYNLKAVLLASRSSLSTDPGFGKSRESLQASKRAVAALMGERTGDRKDLRPLKVDPAKPRWDGGIAGTREM